MTDRRYLKRRGEVWWFQLSVPSGVQAAYGKRLIEQSLRTRDLAVAQELRWKLRHEYGQIFKRLRNGAALTSAEIEIEAQQAYRQTLDAPPGGFRASPEEPPSGEPSEDPEIAGLDWALGDVLDALAQDDFSAVKGEAATVIETSGARMPEGSREYRDLCVSLLRARAAAYRAMIAAKKGEPYDPPVALNPSAIDLSTGRPRVTVPKAKKGNGTPFSEAAATYVAERMRDRTAAWREQTRAQNEGTFRMFKEFIRDCPISKVTREDVSGFLDALARLNRNYARSATTNGWSIWKLLEECTDPPTLTNKTLNRHASALSGLFRWARRRGWYSGENPASDQMRRVGRADQRKFLPFTVDELQTFVSAPLLAIHTQRTKPNRHTMKTALMWAPLIALFSGMRSEEVLQLRADDVRKEGRIWYFNVAESENGQRVKTEAGVRRVPVHSVLVKAGLLKYVKHAVGHSSGQLFPGLKRGGPDRKFNWYFTRAFNTYRRGLGIDRPRVGFHSFRANVATALERAKVPQHEAAQIVGHERLGMTYGRYSVGLDLPALREIVERIAYPGLELSSLDNP